MICKQSLLLISFYAWKAPESNTKKDLFNLLQKVISLWLKNNYGFVFTHGDDGWSFHAIPKEHQNLAPGMELNEACLLPCRSHPACQPFSERSGHMVALHLVIFRSLLAGDQDIDQKHASVTVASLPQISRRLVTQVVLGRWLIPHSRP